VSNYNPDFFRPTRASEKLLKHAGEILEEIDPSLKKELYEEFGDSQFFTLTNDIPFIG
jgi:hypothetical protein